MQVKFLRGYFDAEGNEHRADEVADLPDEEAAACIENGMAEEYAEAAEEAAEE